MITTLLFDFSRVFIFPKDASYQGSLNAFYRQIIEKPYNFFDYFFFNEELLEFVKTLKTHYSLNIFTTDIIQNDQAVRGEIDAIFSHVFSASELGFSKKQTEPYVIIAKTLQAQPSEILFIDDTIENVEAAKQAGLAAIPYLSNEQIMNELRQLK